MISAVDLFFRYAGRGGLRWIHLPSASAAVPDPADRKPKDARLSSRNLCFRYSGQPRDASRAAGFSGGGGEIIAPIGANGVGKTTLAMLRCGLLREHGGQVAIDGLARKAKERMRLCRLVLQEADHQLFTESAFKELKLGFNGSGRDSGRVTELLDAIGLGGKAHTRPRSLSGGEKQRLAMATALAAEQAVLILDEPTSGLDACNMRRMGNLLKAAAGRGSVVLVATHDAESYKPAVPRYCEWKKEVSPMGKLPEVKSDFNELSNLYFGVFASRLMMTAIDMKVFDHLEQPRSSGKIAEVLAADPGNTELLLNALCACNLISKKNGLYRNRQTTSEFLVCGKPTYLGEWYQQADEASQPFLDCLADKIKFGPGDSPEDENMNSEAFCERYTAAHAATSLGGIARDFARHISGLPRFLSFRTMLDMGGGPGINAMAVAQENPHIRATVFDRPVIASMASTYIRTYGFGDRVAAVGGDYLKDPLGEGYDLVMITDTLYYQEREIEPVLQKCYGALNPGGVLTAIHAVLTDEGTRPANLVLDLLTETMTGQARMPEKGFLVSILERCGFKEVTSQMVNIGGTPMEMNVGRV